MFENKFSTHNPSREEWTNILYVLSQDDIEIYTDGSFQKYGRSWGFSAKLKTLPTLPDFLTNVQSSYPSGSTDNKVEVLTIYVEWIGKQRR